jgi:hypothetical protein
VERAAPVFCAIAKDTLADPSPEAGETVTHGTLDDDQLPPWHPDGEPVTVIVCELAAAGAFTDVGVTAKLVHVPACVMVYALPAMVMWPMRWELAFAAMVKPVVPEPFPAAPLVTVIHETSAATCHPQDVPGTDGAMLTVCDELALTTAVPTEPMAYVQPNDCVKSTLSSVNGNRPPPW